MKFFLAVLLSLIAVVLSGCANEKAHENYKATLSSFVGRNISDARNFFRGDDMEVKQLPNGHSEYRFTIQYKANFGPPYEPCTSIFEVDPASQKILRADFIGTKHDCIIPL